MSGQLQPEKERPPTSFTEEWAGELGLGGSTELGQEPRPRWETPGVNCSLVDVLDYSPALLVQFFHDEGLSSPSTLQIPLGVLSSQSCISIHPSALSLSVGFYLHHSLPRLSHWVPVFTLSLNLGLFICITSRTPSFLVVPRRPLAGPPSGIKCP